MAHHVARLMIEAQGATGALGDGLREKCRRAILDLWKARHAIFENAPLRSIEEVGASLCALRDGDGWFFRGSRDGEDSLAKPVQFARAVDQGARAIIRALIGDAVRQGLAQEKDWIWLIRSEIPDIERIVILLEEADFTSMPIGDESQQGIDAVDAEEHAIAIRLQAERNELSKRLRAFASVADEIALHLETPIGAGLATRGRRGMT